MKHITRSRYLTKEEADKYNKIREQVMNEYPPACSWPRQINMKFPKGIHKTRKPKMTIHRGRTWDYCKVILPDGHEIDGHFDTSWGVKFYFEHDQVWYAGNLDKWHNSGTNQVVCDLRKPT